MCKKREEERGRRGKGEEGKGGGGKRGRREKGEEGKGGGEEGGREGKYQEGIYLITFKFIQQSLISEDVIKLLKVKICIMIILVGHQETYLHKIDHFEPHYYDLE